MLAFFDSVKGPFEHPTGFFWKYMGQHGGGGHYSLKGTVFTSEYCPGK